MKRMLVFSLCALMLAGLSGCPLTGGGVDKALLGLWVISPVQLGTSWAGANLDGAYWVETWDTSTLEFGEMDKDTDRGAFTWSIKRLYQVVQVSADGTETLKAVKEVTRQTVTGQYKTKAYDKADLQGVNIEDGTELWAERVLDVMGVQQSAVLDVDWDWEGGTVVFEEATIPAGALPVLPAPLVWRGVYTVDSFGDLNIAMSPLGETAGQPAPGLDAGQNVYLRAEREK